MEAGINRKAFSYNVPLVRTAVESPDLDFGPLYLQAVKLSENGKYVVFRLSEQDGQRGTVKLPLKGYLMNMLEDVEGEEAMERISYKPFEILTVGVPVEEYLKR